MKFTLICLSVILAAASSAPQFPFLPAIGSPWLPVQPCAQDELGRLIPPGGLVYPRPAQGNIQIGSWPWGPMGLTPFYPTDPRFLVLPGTGFPVAPAVTSKVIKPTVPVTQPITSDDKSKLKPSLKEVPKPVAPVAPVAPVRPTPARELKPKELTSSTPTVAERSRCLQDYRAKKYEVPETAAYMVGSDIAYQNQFPFMVALVVKNKNRVECGGSLISPTKILTAAHCVTEGISTTLMDADLFTVHLGMHFFNSTTNDAQLKRRVVRIKTHEDFYYAGSTKATPYNDIAIVTMDAPVQYTDTISPVCLVPNCIKDDNEQEVTAMGWGKTKSGGKNSDYLRFAELSTVTNAKCQEAHFDDIYDDQSVCAYKAGQDTCQSDSGGPIVIDFNKGRQSGFENSCRFMQVGVVSWGDECAKKDSPGIYARVKSYLPWILKHSK